MSGDEAQGNGIIPLSRFRAELARARRGRRADEILASPDAAKLVPSLPVQELYYAIREVGLADAAELVALATPKQFRGFVDLDGWKREELDVTRVADWLSVALEAGPAKLKSVVEGLDPELISLFLARSLRVYDLTLEDPVPDEPTGHFYPTPDGFFLLDIFAEAERGRAVERMVDHLYRADLGMARHLLMAARAELPSELEEWSYRWRSGRMADLGYVEYHEALGVYAFLDPNDTQGPPPSVAPPLPEEGARLPAQLAAVLDAGSFFARTLGEIHDADRLARVEERVLLLVNKAMAADLVEPGDLEAAREVIGRAEGYLSMGLELLSRGDLTVAATALSGDGIERIFRRGVSIVAQLSRLAQTLTQARPLADGPWAALLTALAERRPRLPLALITRGASGVRPFRSVADVRLASDALQSFAHQGPALFAVLGVGPTDLPVLARRARELHYGTLARTAAANLALGRSATAAPIHPRERAQLPAKPDHAPLAALLERRVPASEVAVWLDIWLSDWALAAPDGILLRPTWLR
jgi:hypothetical protein